MAIPARIKPNANRGLGVSDLLIDEVELQPENNRRDPEVTAFGVFVPTVAMLEDARSPDFAALEARARAGAEVGRR
jgi:hypothetical protein